MATDAPKCNQFGINNSNLWVQLTLSFPHILWIYRIPMYICPWHMLVTIIISLMIHKFRLESLFHFDGSGQERCNSSALAMELRFLALSHRFMIHKQNILQSMMALEPYSFRIAKQKKVHPAEVTWQSPRIWEILHISPGFSFASRVSVCLDRTWNMYGVQQWHILQHLTQCYLNVLFGDIHIHTASAPNGTIAKFGALARWSNNIPCCKIYTEENFSHKIQLKTQF